MILSSQQLLEDLGAFELTPVQEVEGVFFKRDDLFTPFGLGNVNGGKFRQGAFLLAQAKEQGYKRILTGCSLNSPQAPIIAALSKYFGMECIVFYGGTKKEYLDEKHMPRLVKHFGAEIQIANSGRSSVLYHEIKKIKEDGDFIVNYGMNSKDPHNLVAFYDSTAIQVHNLPEEIEHLAVTCGSGITAAGIIYGLQKWNRKVNHVWLLGTAPSRKKKVQDRLSNLAMLTGVNCWNYPFNYMDLFAEGMTYEKRVEDISFGDIKFHPVYEAKTFTWVKKNLIGKSLIHEGKIVYWIVGNEPELLKGVK